jgi:hypothetical protein
VGVEVSAVPLFRCYIQQPIPVRARNYPSTKSKDQLYRSQRTPSNTISSPKHQANETTKEAMPASQLQGLLSDLTEDFQATQSAGDVLQFCADWFQARLKAEVSFFLGWVSSGFGKVDGQGVECGGFPFGTNHAAGRSLFNLWRE